MPTLTINDHAALTTDHAASSYGIPELVIDGTAYGTLDALPEGMEGIWADVLRALRTHLDLTQTEMAERLGVHKNTVARIERGEISISGPVRKLLQTLVE